LYSQDSKGLQTYFIDTVRLDCLAAKKIIVYQAPNYTILLDYAEVQGRFERISTGKISYHANLAKYFLNQIKDKYELFDTVFVNHTVIKELGWVFNDDFLCSQLAYRNCLIQDKDGVIHREILRYYGLHAEHGYYDWGGELYYLPGVKDPFIECTIWIN
jgi:hypothetical protein